MLKKLALIIEHMDEHLQVHFYFLMGVGLLLASYFLYTGKLTGTDWMMVCGILYGSNSLGHGVSRIGGTRPNSRFNGRYDDGSERPM